MSEFVVPTEVAVALGTNRVEFLKMLASQLEKADRRLTKDEGLGLIQMIIELVQERLEQNKKLAQVQEWIENGVLGNAKGIITRGNRLLNVLEGKDPDDYRRGSDD